MGLISSAVLFSRSALKDSTAAPARIAKFLATPVRPVELQFTLPQIVKIGAPIFLEKDGMAKPIGRITRVESADSTETKEVITSVAYAELFSNAPVVTESAYLTFHETPGDFGWVVEMMLPQKNRDEIGRLIMSAYADHQREIVSALRPVVEKSIADATEIIREDLQVAIANREAELNQLGNKFQNDLVEKEIVPLVQNEIWPIVRYESEPLVTEIGQEIWKEVSVWRFTWKYLYDRSPLPERNLAQKEFRRFVDGKAVPILEAHIGDFVSVQQEILKQVSQNEKVKATVAKSIREVAEDPEVQKLFVEVFQEVFVDNPRLQKVLEENWQSPEAQKALAMTNARLEPTITEIGQTLFGSPDEEITPEFSRVLRHKILRKDARWLVIHDDEAGKSETDPSTSKLNRASQIRVIKVVPGATSTENPFHIPATKRESK